jgi:diaminopimelate epimerase
MMNFVKMHGAGNDFVVMEAAGDEHDWPRLATTMCDRHFGVGADGLLLALRSSHAEIRMRVFNSDGSEAEMCGNGIRCLAKYAVEKGLVKPADGRFSIETMASVVSVEVSGEGGKVDRVRVGMGVPGLTPEEIPVLVHRETPLVNLPLEVGRGSTAGDSTRDILPVTCVSMGNPHAVQFVNQPVADFSLEEVGPRVAEHPQFPRGVNFEVARVIDRSHIEARVWERGAGLTLACGSGACAVMVAARLQGLVDDAVDITLPGGTLTLEWDGKGIVYLTGPAVTVFTGEWLLGG